MILRRLDPVQRLKISFLLRPQIGACCLPVCLLVLLWVFFLIYLSGALPPLPTTVSMAQIREEDERAAAEKLAQAQQREEVEENSHFDFYDELPRYEVKVDATPLLLEATDYEPESTTTDKYMLQAGVFQKRQNALQRQSELITLGVEASIKPVFVGQTRYVVQIGPFSSRRQLDSMRSTLRRHSIDSVPVRLL